MGKIITAHFLTISLCTVMVSTLFLKNKTSRFKVSKERLKPVQLEVQKLLEPFLIFPLLAGNIF